MTLHSFFLYGLTFFVALVNRGSPGYETASTPVRRASSANETPELASLRLRGNALFRAGDYLKAASVYEQGVRRAIAEHRTTDALRLLNNLGGARFKMFQYRDALRAYLMAERFARETNDQSTLAAALFNLSSLYSISGEADSASEAASEGLRLPPEASSKFRPKLLIQAGLIDLNRGEPVKALSKMQAAVSLARATGDRATEAQALSELGHALFLQANYPDADHALTEALHLREVLGGDALHYSLEALGELRFRQGFPQCALAIYRRAVESAVPFGPAASWTARYLHGSVLLASGDFRMAYRDFADAMADVRKSRAEILPADAFRVSSAVQLRQLYSSFIEAGSMLYQYTHDVRYARQTLAAAEDNRAVILRDLWAGKDLSERLDPSYGQALNDLQQAEIAEIRNVRGASDAARRARVKITALELQAGLDLPKMAAEDDSANPDILRYLQQKLKRDEVYFGFHIDGAVSCMWVVTRERLAFRTLPSGPDWNTEIARLQKDIQNGGGLDSSFSGIYERLFAGLDRVFVDKRVWIIAPDGPLFDLPFAALPLPSEQRSDGSKFLIEKHVLSFVPGMDSIGAAREANSFGPLVALGDPVYNRADDRFRQRPRARAAAAGRGQALQMELNRLPGTGREVEACVANWRSHGSRARVMEGWDANREKLASALKTNPEVLHIAVHLIQPKTESGQPDLALSLLPEGQVELISPPEISRMRSKIGMVVLDGCSSGTGEILPGAGLIGMTRAWLAAGANAVVATRWSINDRNSGGFFQRFYENYYQSSATGGRRVAEVLQQTQIEQLRSRGAQSAPAYWSAYLVVEKS